jgi:hypothetical protein
MIGADTIISYEIVGFANNIWNVTELCELVDDRRECDRRVSDNLGLGANRELYH